MDKLSYWKGVTLSDLHHNIHIVDGAILAPAHSYCDIIDFGVKLYVILIS